MAHYGWVRGWRGIVVVILVAGLGSASTATRAAKPAAPVATVGSRGLRISTPRGSAVVPYLISLDGSQPQAQIARAVIIFHGKGRDVEGYYRTALAAADAAGSASRDTTVFLAPQFLDEEDIGSHRLAADVLRWRQTDWESGEPAIAPFSMSSFEVVDALLARLSDRSTFPNLKTVVLAGHSGGGQLVQRYAVVGRALAAVSRAGIHLRFVVANPSSYLYFSDERPAGAALCPRFNRWKYGTVDPIGYVKLDAANSWPQMEADYAQRDVIYLLGTADTDPHEKDLDVTCGGEAQGPTRFARGQAYYAYLHGRHDTGWNQRLWCVPGVSHSAYKMLTSACGVAALFDAGQCPDR
jgi:pimeloyl-ACP methyl ester carboxylesterase